MIVVAGLDAVEQATLESLLGQLDSKRALNNRRSAFYEMKHDADALMGKEIPEVVRRRSFVLGWSAIAVDKLNRRCGIEGFYSPSGDDLDGLGLSDLVRLNRLQNEVSRAGIGALIHGVSFLVRFAGDPSKGEPKVIVRARSARTATGSWNQRTRRLDSFLTIDGQDDGDITAMTLFLPNRTIHMQRRSGVWSVSRTAHSHGVPVNALVYRPDLDKPHGSSRISHAVMSIHAQALAAMIRADVNGEAYSLPRYVLLGATESSFQTADGKPKPAWKAAWDAVWTIGDDEGLLDDGNALARADVKQFLGQSPEPQNAHLRMLAQMFSGETGIPIGELGIIGDSNPTSEGALSVSQQDIIAEAEATTAVWAPEVAACVSGALSMWSGADEPDVVPRYRDPRYTSKSAAADAGLKTVQALPWLGETEVGMEIMGLSRSQIDRAMAERRRARVADSLAALSSAAAVQPAQPERTPSDIKAAADAMGVLIRSGVAAESAAAQVGLQGVEFTGAVPVSLRLPEPDAARLEE